MAKTATIKDLTILRKAAGGRNSTESVFAWPWQETSVVCSLTVCGVALLTATCLGRLLK